MAVDRSPRLRRIEAMWSWLPAFRAVAEVGHLGDAAQLLAVSRSALSRTVRLLEDAIGTPLFVRHDAGLVLTPAGAALLAAVRGGMRAVDDVVAAIDNDAQPLRVGADDGVLWLLVGALGVDVARVDAAGAAAQVRLGALDVAFVTDSEGIGDLMAVDVGALPRATFGDGAPAAEPAVALAHALAGRAAVLPVALGRALGRTPTGDAPPLAVTALRRLNGAGRLETRIDACIARVHAVIPRATLGRDLGAAPPAPASAVRGH